MHTWETMQELHDSMKIHSHIERENVKLAVTETIVVVSLIVLGFLGGCLAMVLS